MQQTHHDESNLHTKKGRLDVFRERRDDAAVIIWDDNTTNNSMILWCRVMLSTQYDCSLFVQKELKGKPPGGGRGPDLLLGERSHHRVDLLCEE